MHPVFAIAVPVRKQAEFIGTAMESLRHQKVPVAIGVMDATPDDSVAAVLAPYRQQLAYHRHSKAGDNGQSAAINEGLRNVDGNICGWLNADDLLMPNALEHVAAAFAGDPALDVVYGHSLILNKEGGFEGYFPGLMQRPQELFAGNPLAQPACFFSRRLISRLGGVNESLHYVMDWDLWQRAAKAGVKFKRLEQPLACMRLYPDTKTASMSKRRYAEMAQLLAGQSFLNTTRLLGKTAISDYFGGLPFQRRYHRLLSRLGIARNQEQINGIAVSTNEVLGQASLTLPCYSKNKRTRITLTLANKPTSAIGRNIKIRVPQTAWVSAQEIDDKLLFSLDYKSIDGALTLEIACENPHQFLRTLHLE